MCGRFTLATPADVLAAFFDVDDLGFGDSPHYNIAPTARIATVRNRTGTRRAEATIWGASNPKDGRPIINARSETVATSPLFGRAFANARILVPADGFFEWVKDGRARRARYFHQPGRAPFAFAGIAVEPRKETEEEGAVILTTAASPSVAPVHDRMPVVILRDAFSLWLNRESRVDAVQRLFEDASRVAWVSHPVSAAVNNVRNDGPGNIAPAAHAPDAQGSLF